MDIPTNQFICIIEPSKHYLNASRASTLSIKQHVDSEDEYAKYQESSDDERVENVPCLVVIRSGRSYICHEDN